MKYWGAGTSATHTFLLRDPTRRTCCSVVQGANYVYHCAAHLDKEDYSTTGQRKQLVVDAVESQLDIIRVRPSQQPRTNVP